MTIFVSYEEANAFLFARNHFPDGTPNRWELVAEFVRAQEKLSQAGPTISFSCNGQQNFTSVKHLNLTKIDDCRTLDRLITNNYSKIFQRDLIHSLCRSSAGKSAIKPVILLPPIVQCCDRKIKMDSRPSFPLLYTVNGTYVGALFHGQCYSCKTQFYPSFKVVDGLRFYYDPNIERERYFQVTSQTVFDKQLLKDFSNNIWVEGATLQSRAKVYKLNFEASDKVRLAQLEEFARKKHGNWQLNEDRVSDAWFLWVIINYFQNHGKLNRMGINVQYDENSKHIKVEQLCQIMWEDICASPNKWVRHSCKTPGCSEGYVTVDGNEYLKRSKCALPK